jgi:hypothetical protein
MVAQFLCVEYMEGMNLSRGEGHLHFIQLKRLDESLYLFHGHPLFL